MIHPRDWVKVFESHTEYEWALQIALENVEPTGERRADLRDGWNTARIIASNRIESTPMSELQQMASTCANYLEVKRMLDIENGLEEE